MKQRKIKNKKFHTFRVIASSAFVFAFLVFSLSTSIFGFNLNTVHAMEASCTLTASSNSIEEGGTVEVVWESVGGISGVLNPGNIDLAPLTGGSMTFNPTEDTIFTAVVESSSASASCEVSVGVVSVPPPPPPPPPPPGTLSCSLSLSQSSIAEGESADLSWITTEAILALLTPGDVGLTTLPSGSLSLTPTESTTYVVTVESADGETASCEIPLDVTTTPPPPPPPPPPVCTENCGGGGGGGGGFTPPEVVLLQGPPAGEQLAFVTLSQVPYTGFPAGPIGTALFWTTLILLSGVVAYFVSVRGVSVTSLFRNFAYNNRYEDDRYNDISSLEEDGSSGDVDQNAVHNQFDQDSVVSESDLVEDHLKERASDIGVLLSGDGARNLLLEAGGDRYVAYALLDKAIVRAREVYPREDGWLHINKERLASIVSPEVRTLNGINQVPENLPSNMSQSLGKTREKTFSLERESYTQNSTQGSPEVFVFIGWICEGNGEKIFAFMRSLKSQGKSDYGFLVKVLSVFDTAYRQRIESGGDLDSYVTLQTRRFSKDDLEKIIGLLSFGADYGYRETSVGVKMALMQTLDFIESKIENK